MRMLHTSDWHLGRSLHRADLRAAQAAFLDHLVSTVRSEKVDVVLVAGDIYDRAVPPVDAVELCEDALLRLHDTGARIVLISGNHDSARRLGFGSGLLDQAGVHLRTRIGALAQPVLLEDAHGPVAVYGVPYAEPDAVRGELPPETGQGHAGVLGHAVRSIQADADARGVRRRVVLAHGWVTGGAVSDSERDITVGGVGQVPAEYLRRVQLRRALVTCTASRRSPSICATAARRCPTRSPRRPTARAAGWSSWTRPASAGPSACPRPPTVELSQLRGRLADLLGSSAYAEFEQDFVSVTLTDPGRPDGPMDLLRARFPHILVLAFDPDGVRARRPWLPGPGRGPRRPAIAEGFVQHVRNAAAHRKRTAAADRRVRGRRDWRRQADAPAPAARDRVRCVRRHRRGVLR